MGTAFLFGQGTAAAACCCHAFLALQADHADMVPLCALRCAALQAEDLLESYFMQVGAI